MMNFSTLQGLTIPEGVVTQIAKDGVVLWKLETNKPVVLEVEKITSDTYAGETTYTGEQFILLDIYPKTNGTVNITYGGLTKTITDTSGAAEPNAQEVFFGTFNGVSDSVATPVSGELTIEGDVRGVSIGHFYEDSKGIATNCNCVTKITNLGNSIIVPDEAYGSINNLTTILDIPATVTYIGVAAFMGVPIEMLTIKGNPYIGASAFQICPLKTVRMFVATPPEMVSSTNSSTGETYGCFGSKTDATFALEEIIVPKGSGEAYKTAEGWSYYADYIVEVS